jgi:urease accessory protein
VIAIAPRRDAHLTFDRPLFSELPMTPRLSSTLRWALPCLLATGSALALAHTGTDGAAHHGMADAAAAGFTHPFTGLDHLAAMVALGVWSALTARRVALAPLAFASALLGGALLGFAGLSLPAVEPMIASSLLAIGLLVASRAAMPAALGMAIAASFALFHGMAHGQALIGPFGAWALAGMVGATALLHTSGIALGLAMKRSPLWLPRVAGAAVALFGASLLIVA